MLYFCFTHSMLLRKYASPSICVTMKNDFQCFDRYTKRRQAYNWLDFEWNTRNSGDQNRESLSISYPRLIPPCFYRKASLSFFLLMLSSWRHKNTIRQMGSVIMWRLSNQDEEEDERRREKGRDWGQDETWTHGDEETDHPLFSSCCVLQPVILYHQSAGFTFSHSIYTHTNPFLLISCLPSPLTSLIKEASGIIIVIIFIPTVASTERGNTHSTLQSLIPVTPSSSSFALILRPLHLTRISCVPADHYSSR